MHHCNSVETGASELPALLKGSKVIPSTGVGSNATNAESKIPVAVVVGGGFSPEEFDKILQACNAVKLLPFFRSDTSRSKTPGPPPPDELKRRLLESMDEAAKGNGAGNWEAGVHLF